MKVNILNNNASGGRLHVFGQTLLQIFNIQEFTLFPIFKCPTRDFPGYWISTNHPIFDILKTFDHLQYSAIFNVSFGANVECPHMPGTLIFNIQESSAIFSIFKCTRPRKKGRNANYDSNLWYSIFECPQNRGMLQKTIGILLLPLACTRLGHDVETLWAI